jgi:hypothetical protein
MNNRRLIFDYNPLTGPDGRRLGRRVVRVILQVWRLEGVKILCHEVEK